MSLLSQKLEELEQQGLEALGKYYSLYRGIVTSNQDPQRQGRLQIRVPEISGETAPDYWAWPKGLFAGKGKGLFAIPSVGDAVWVEYEKGDPSYPVWNYGWWATGQVPQAGQRAEPTNTVLQTAAGQLLELDDEGALIRLTAKGGKVIEINEKGISLGKATEGDEPAVLGDQLADLLEKLLNALAGESMLKVPAYQALLPLIATIKSKTVTLTK